MAVDVEIGADHVVTVSVNGSLTQTLPELTIPSDLTAHLPPNGIGLEELGLGGIDPTSLLPGGADDGPAEQPGS